MICGAARGWERVIRVVQTQLGERCLFGDVELAWRVSQRVGSGFGVSLSVEGWMWSEPGRLPLLAPWKEVVVGLRGRGEVLGARCSCLQELNEGWGRPLLRRA